MGLVELMRAIEIAAAAANRQRIGALVLSLMKLGIYRFEPETQEMAIRVFRPACMMAKVIGLQVITVLDLYPLFAKARTLTPEEVIDLESRIQTDPDEFESHYLLLEYYGEKSLTDAQAAEKTNIHYEWLALNHPDLKNSFNSFCLMRDFCGPVFFAKIRNIFLAHLRHRPENPYIIKNAVKAFAHDDPIFALDLLKRGKQSFPDDASWSRDLAHKYRLMGDGYQQLALQECLASLKYEDESKWQEPDLLCDLYVNGQKDRAFAACNTMLQLAAKYNRAKRHGDIINTANTVLGLIALDSDDLSLAKHHLHLSSQGASSPVNCSFGPMLDLASAFIDRGDQQAAIDYLQECKAFWKPAKHVNDLILEIEAGNNPLLKKLDLEPDFYTMGKLVRSYYNNGHLLDAQTQIDKIATTPPDYDQQNSWYGRAQHIANVVSGQIALQNSDPAVAQSYLDKAALYLDEITGDGLTADLSLCYDLIKAGQAQTVEFFLQKASTMQNRVRPEFSPAWFVEQVQTDAISLDSVW